MKNKTIIYYLAIFVFLNISNIIFANEINFDTKDIEISNNGNTVVAGKGVAKLIEESIEIYAEEFKYLKNLSILEAYDGVAIAAKNVCNQHSTVNLCMYDTVN